MHVCIKFRQIWLLGSHNFLSYFRILIDIVAISERHSRIILASNSWKFYSKYVYGILFMIMCTEIKEILRFFFNIMLSYHTKVPSEHQILVWEILGFLGKSRKSFSYLQMASANGVDRLRRNWILYIYTHNWTLQPFSQDYDLTYVACVNFICMYVWDRRNARKFYNPNLCKINIQSKNPNY